jgi:hypothetical protein
MKLDIAVFEEQNPMKGGYLAWCLTPVPVLSPDSLGSRIRADQPYPVWGPTREKAVQNLLKYLTEEHLKHVTRAMKGLSLETVDLDLS